MFIPANVQKNYEIIKIVLEIVKSIKKNSTFVA